MAIPKLKTITQPRTTPKEKHPHNSSIKEIPPLSTQVITLCNKNVKIIRSVIMT